MIVVDASMVVEVLLGNAPGGRLLRRETCFVPHLADAEVAHSLRGLRLGGKVSSREATRMLGAWQRLGVVRFAMHPLLVRVWELGDNLTSHDACYVALAEELGCALVTADVRIAQAPGVRCEVRVLGDD